MQQILVVDDEVGIRELLSEILSEEGYQVQLAQNAAEARAFRARVRPELVLLDIWMPDTDGITLLKEWASSGLLTMPVVMMSGHGTIDTAVQATRIGAYDFLEKPIALQKLLATVGRALKHGGEQAQPAWSLATLGRSRLMLEFKQRLERVAGLRTPVLLVGEPGCATEQCARFLHVRNTPWLVPENHARLAEAPLELLTQARDGTLFFHDISGLNRLEQKGLAMLLGKTSRYNARVVCGSTRDLAELVATGAQIVERIADLERQVIQPDLPLQWRRGLCADFQQREVMVVVAAREERHLAAVARHFGEPEHVAVERHRHFQAAHLQHRMAKLLYAHGRLLHSRISPST